MLSSVIMAMVVTLALNATCLGGTGVTASEQRAIYAVLEKLTEAIVGEDIDSAMGLFSPNMDDEKREEIKQVLEQKFSTYDYRRYRFDMPLIQNIKVLEPERRVEFKARYAEEYRSKTRGSGSSSGLSSKFVMERVGGKWLILDTDFYSKRNIMKFLGILGIIFALFVVAALISFPFWVWMLIDCAKREFPKPDEKIAWIVVIVFTQAIGAIIYYFIVRRKARQATQ